MPSLEERRMDAWTALAAEPAGENTPSNPVAEGEPRESADRREHLAATTRTSAAVPRTEEPARLRAPIELRCTADG